MKPVTEFDRYLLLTYFYSELQYFPSNNQMFFVTSRFLYEIVMLAERNASMTEADLQDKYKRLRSAYYKMLK